MCVAPCRVSGACRLSRPVCVPVLSQNQMLNLYLRPAASCPLKNSPNSVSTQVRPVVYQ